MTASWSEVSKFIFAFPPALSKESPKPSVEIVFSFDTTGSMAPYLNSVKNKLSAICQRLIDDIPNLRIGLIAHGDYCDAHDGSYVLKRMGFSNDASKLQDFVRRECGNTGGGDAPECYELVLREAKKFHWSEGTIKALVVLGDAPPHKPTEYLHVDWKEELAELKKMGIRCHGISCGHGQDPFYKTIAVETGGLLVKLEDSSVMTELFTELCYRMQQAYSQVNAGPAPELDAAPIIMRKQALVNTVCACLLKEPRFYSTEDDNRARIARLALAVCKGEGADPEFLLKTAAYVRNSLYIRSTSSFLLALACTQEACRSLIPTYFNHICKIPSDVLELCDFLHTIPENTLPTKGIPAVVRKCIATTFASYSEYTLGKYKGKGKKAAPKKKAKKEGEEEKEEEGSASEGEEEGEKKPEEPAKQAAASSPEKAPAKMSLKHLVNVCHIAEPAQMVMGLLGRKYPATEEDFAKSRLPGSFDASRAGKRMKLAVPVTWETQLSAKGNTAEVWESLIDSRSVPFMAMLRNLRNILRSGVSEAHHAKILARLTNEDQVTASKQLPIRFLNAYRAIDFSDDEIEAHANGQPRPEPSEASPKFGRGGRRGGRGGRGGPRPAPAVRMTLADQPETEEEAAEEETVKEPKKPKNPLTRPILDQYKEALDTAIKIATINNIAPLRGNVAIFVDVSASMTYNMGETLKGIPATKTAADVGILLGLMIKYVSESGDLVLFSSPAENGGNDKGWFKVDLEGDNILKNFTNVESIRTSARLGLETQFPYTYLDEISSQKKLDYIVVISDMIIHPDRVHPSGSQVFSQIEEYRKSTNPDLCFVCVDLFGSGSQVLVDDVEGVSARRNDILISGYSDQILRFINMRRNPLAQISAVENILEEIKESKGASSE